MNSIRLTLISLSAGFANLALLNGQNVRDFWGIENHSGSNVEIKGLCVNQALKLSISQIIS